MKTLTDRPLLTITTRPHFDHLLQAQALKPNPDPAIIYLATSGTAAGGIDATTITRAQFHAHTHAYAQALLNLGLQPGNLVVIAHTQSLESIYAFWGALLIGAIPSMFPTLTEKLDPEIYISGIATLVQHSGVSIVLTTDEFAPLLAPHLACPVVGSANLPIASGTKQSFVPEAMNVAFLQHSSGTTGLQKGVALSHAAVLNQIASYSDALALSEKDSIVSWLPLYHDMGLIAGFILPLYQGLPLILMSPFDWVAHPALLLHAIHTYRPTLCWLPNFAYNHCALRIRQRDSQGLDLSSIRMWINCSEPVRLASHQLFLERFAAHGVAPASLAVSYAMAENTFAVTQTPPGQPPRLDWVDRNALETQQIALPAAPHAPGALAVVSCGPPIPNTQAAVLDEAGSRLPERRVGEVGVRSDCMLSGYYRRPDLNAHLFVDDWYRTGDMGYLAGGEVYIIGRKKDLIIHGGKNIYPQDIEALVNRVPGVHPGRVVAFGVYDERQGTELIAVVAEVDTQEAAEQARISAEIRRTVAQGSSVTASYVKLVDSRWLIKTSSGKIARAANREKWLKEVQDQL